ncbi:leucine-rich melanocyte differentiation-associated protein-like [Chironomus tepperi]|uniref:leucine-rich melanocyte differentiation-associated protein-like n=1 Tax=Chironomus tepperi TaxID=113505 RepID=UPI00391FA0E3
MIYNYFENEKRLIYYEHDADQIPSEIINEFRDKDVTQIDFSSNSLMSIDFISNFPNLNEIILDNNFLSDETMFPNKVFLKIQLLSLNNNKFEDLDKLVYNICYSFPNLRHLSLLGNPLCPVLNENYNEDDYQSYRLLIISRMPKLKFLDSKMITRHEWSIIHTNIPKVEEAVGRVQKINSMDPISFLKKFFKYQSAKEVESVDEVDHSNYTALPTEGNTGSQEPRSSYSKCKHFYQGTESQGNRFIGNKML